MTKKEQQEAFRRILDRKIEASGIAHGEGQAEWQYRIEPYRRMRGEFGWTRAEDGTADAWFGFRDKGDDHRCFGVFPTRKDAERAMEILKAQERQEIKASLKI